MSPSRTFLLTFLFLVLSDFSPCNGYRIFAVFPYHGRSHFRVLENVAKALAEAGHQVDVVSTFPRTNPLPNYTDVVKLPNTRTRAFMDYRDLISLEIKSFHANSRKMCEFLGRPDVARIVKNPPKDRPYDLVLTHFYIGYQCYSAVAHLWNVPVVGVVTTAMYSPNYRMIGSPLNLAIAPKNFYFYKENMTFWERVCNTVMVHRRIHEYDTLAWRQDDLIRKYLGPDLPSYTELEKSVSLIMTNSHFSFNGIQPKNPAHIEIGGIHIQNANLTTPADLKKIMDESKHGFVYFSFGSLVKVESFPQEWFDKFYKAFRKLAPLRMLFKSEEPEALPRGKPSNVYTFSWFPQEQVLQHPNIKGFVTHGGGLGIQEAVYYGVPLICMPLFADQVIHCGIASEKKFGVKINFQSARQEDIDRAFDEIINNPTYRESAKKMSARFRDRPMKPKEEAVFWIEYVIRHGKNALRSRAVDLAWWQAELLDVYAFLVFCFITLLCIIALFVRLLIKLILRRAKIVISDSKRQNKKIN